MSTPSHSKSSVLASGGGVALIDPADTVILLLDHQSGLFQTVKDIPVGVAYAVWSGLGIVLVSLIGVVLFGQKLDAPALVGMGLIIAGVLVMNLFSRSVPHV